VKLSILDSEKQLLAELLEAIQRCVYFLDASSCKLTWPLTADLLETQKKDVVLFEVMAAINERFAKLQDTLGAAMRHACILAGEPTDNFLKVLSFYQKQVYSNRLNLGNYVVQPVILPHMTTILTMQKLQTILIR
jgi:hypothetical protein